MKRYQAVKIEKREYLNNEHAHVVTIHDRQGKGGIDYAWYYNLPLKTVVKYLRSEDVEVSKHVENGGSLRLY